MLSTINRHLARGPIGILELAWLVLTRLPRETADALTRDDTRPRRVAVLAGFIWLMSMADLGFTLWAHQYTDFKEGNPLFAPLLELEMYALIIGAKCLLTFLATAIFCRFSRRCTAEVGAMIAFLVYLALTYRWHDYVQQADLLYVF